MSDIIQNPDCPLSESEQAKLITILNDIKLNSYRPFKHSSGGFANAEVWKYDEDTVSVAVECGVDDPDDGVTYKKTVTVDRSLLA